MLNELQREIETTEIVIGIFFAALLIGLIIWVA